MPRKQTKRRTVRKEANRIDHLEQVNVVHETCAIVGAPGPRGRMGLGYIVTARAIPGTGVGGYYRPTLAISLETRREGPGEHQPWTGKITVPADDAWSFLRAVELAVEAAAGAGMVTGTRLSAETAR